MNFASSFDELLPILPPHSIIVMDNASGLEYEADPRHVELIADLLELAGCKPVSTPVVKEPRPFTRTIQGWRRIHRYHATFQR